MQRVGFHVFKHGGYSEPNKTFLSTVREALPNSGCCCHDYHSVPVTVYAIATAHIIGMLKHEPLHWFIPRGTLVPEPSAALPESGCCCAVITTLKSLCTRWCNC